VCMTGQGARPLALERRELVCVPGLNQPEAVERVNEAMRTMLQAGLQPDLADRYR